MMLRKRSLSSSLFGKEYDTGKQDGVRLAVRTSRGKIFWYCGSQMFQTAGGFLLVIVNGLTEGR